MRPLSSILNSAMIDYVSANGKASGSMKAALDAVESPIEAQMMMHITRYDFVVSTDRDLPFDEAVKRARSCVGRVCVFPQVLVGNYRPDFLFLRASEKGATGLVVEADGKDWHYDSEAQIARDNDRLATFAKHRIYTMRFLGREIYQNCALVMSHVIDFFDGKR